MIIMLKILAYVHEAFVQLAVTLYLNSRVIFRRTIGLESVSVLDPEL